MVVPVYFCYFTSATMVTSFILYRGLKAPAIDLITMVLGFLVTCMGITLLQLSKVDPDKLSGLDRKSTMLLSASRHKTEAEEKGDVTSMEEPGMDALRGGFGAVGSIIRARSISRRLSTASGGSSPGRYGFPASDLNTHGMSHLPRYQLSDNPMPDDHMETVALSPVGGAGPQARQTSLSFTNQDVVHQYGYTKHDGKTDAMHGIRVHDPKRQFSGVSSLSMEPVAEEGGEKHLPRLLTTNAPSPTASHGSGSLLSPTHTGHHQAERKTSFSQLFKYATGQDSHDGPHSPGHRGQSYPKVKDAQMEREERAALVADDDDDYGVYSAYLTQDSPGIMEEPVELAELDGGEGDLGSRPAIRPAGPRKPLGPR